MRRFLLVLLWLALPVAGWAQTGSVTLFAAASLTDAIGEIARDYGATGRAPVLTSFASSSDLARQIEQGAPADLFLSADLQWVDYLAERGLVERRVNLLGNDLVLVAPLGSKITLTIAPHFPLLAALAGGRLAVGDPDHVPAGIYAKQALQTLQIWDEIEPVLARAGSVRAALAFVERGEAPLGIVYRTDALSDGKVTIIGQFPSATHEKIVYPLALLAGHMRPKTLELMDYLQSPAALATFRKYGFTTPP